MRPNCQLFKKSQVNGHHHLVTSAWPRVTLILDFSAVKWTRVRVWIEGWLRRLDEGRSRECAPRPYTAMAAIVQGSYPWERNSPDGPWVWRRLVEACNPRERERANSRRTRSRGQASPNYGMDISRLRWLQPCHAKALKSLFYILAL